MSLRFDVYVREPLTPDDWQPVEQEASPTDAVKLMHSWGAWGWRVKVVSSEVRENGEPA